MFQPKASGRETSCPSCRWLDVSKFPYFPEASPSHSLQASGLSVGSTRTGKGGVPSSASDSSACLVLRHTDPQNHI